MQMPIALRIILFLNLASILLPVAMQYLAASSLLIWLIVTKSLFKRKLSIYFLYEADQNSFHKLYKLLWVFFVASLAVAVLSSLSSDYTARFGKILSEAWHLSAKQSILPISLICGFMFLKQKYSKLPEFSRSITIYVTIYTIYCIAQRYFGIDWVRGFSATLPDNRYAYGVYRISGFMGHPLSLAYNLVFAAIVFSFFGYQAYVDGQKSRAFWWFGSAGQMVLVLLLSGSRWPLMVLLLIIIASLGSQILKRWKFVLFGAAVLFAGIYFEGSMLKRVNEVYAGGKLKTDNIPRLVFWKVHAKMFSDQPLLGVGYTSRTKAAEDYYNTMGYEEMERKYSAHNQYLQVLADSGLIGFVVLFGFWFWVLILFKLVTDSKVKKVLYLLVLVVLLSSLMKNVLRDTEFIFGLWVSIASCYLCLPLKQKTQSET